MTDTDVTTSDTVEDHGHGEIHMPPNSWIPVALSISLMFLLVGFISPPQVTIGGVIIPLTAVLGAVLTVICLVAWLRAARAEYLELP